VKTKSGRGSETGTSGSSTDDAEDNITSEEERTRGWSAVQQSPPERTQSLSQRSEAKLHPHAMANRDPTGGYADAFKPARGNRGPRNPQPDAERGELRKTRVATDTGGPSGERSLEAVLGKTRRTEF
jgi:hypothetical protein